MVNYNFKKIERKWQQNWEKKKVFKAEIADKKKILCFRNVSLSFREITYGACKELYIR